MANGSARCLAFPSQLSLQRLLARVLNRQQDSGSIGRSFVPREGAGELAVGGQGTLLELRPYLARKLGLQKLRCEAAERAANVVDVPLEHGERTVITGGVHRLG